MPETAEDFALEEITAMYVNSITFAEKRYGPGGSFVDLMVTVEVLRWSDDEPVADARVKMTLTHDDFQVKFDSETKDDGKVTFTLKRAPTSDYTATVTALTHGIYVWDESKGVTSAEYTVE